jgi:multidrug efflux pump subunit AcrA (membrane-fusion protein)
MPARRRKQSNAMLYTLITFVGLFIASTTVAVIYYVKAEENRTAMEEARRAKNELASDQEIQSLGAIVGTKKSQETWLDVMVNDLNHTISLIMGGVPEPTSAEVKITNANKAVMDALTLAKAQINIPEPNLSDPNIIGLVPVVKQLSSELGNTVSSQQATQKKLDGVQQDLDNANKIYLEKEQMLIAEKTQLQQDVNDIRQKYADLETLLQQTTDQKVQTLTGDLKQMTDDRDRLNSTLLKTQAELDMARGRLRVAEDEVSKTMPAPDPNMMALQPDGKVLLVDNQTNVVRLNIGSDDHVYQGLTFTVYDRGSSIPRDGKGKAEVQVFDIAKNYSAARIIKPDPKKPILEGDLVANLIWSSNRVNVFVVAGEFDLNKDGVINPDGAERVKALIQKWGGKVANAISVDTDFVVLGQPPQVLPMPTLEEREVDPLAMQKYQASVEMLNRYNEIRSQAESLWIPIFTYDRFLYFIGYNEQIGNAGAF